MRPEATADAGSDDSTTVYIAAPVAMEERQPPFLARWAIGLTAFALVGFIVWAAITPVREITIAEGQILPDGFVQPVQHLEGGRVASIAVAEGDRVRAGAPLLELDGAQLRAERAEALARRAAMSLAVERLRAFADGETATFPVLPANLAAIAQTQQSMFDADRERRTARLQAAAADLERRRETLRGAEFTLLMLREERALAASAVERREPLRERGLLRMSEMEAAERDVIRLAREIGATESEVAALRLSIEEADAHLDEIAADLRRAALEESIAAQIEVAAAESTLHRLDDRLDRLVLRSPIEGVVQRVLPKAGGAVIQPGEPVVEIVPADTQVYAEVRVLPAEVGHILKGLPATVKVTTYDYVRFGGIEGVIEHVSPTTEIDQILGPVFRVRVRLAKDHLGKRTSGMIVSPGMEVTADITTGEKSVLRYLTKPIRAAFDRALTER